MCKGNADMFPYLFLPIKHHTAHIYIYMYVCMYVCIHTYIHSYIHTYSLHMLILLHVSMHTEAYIHICKHASMLACTRTHIHVCLHACIQASMYACLHTHGIEMDGWIGRQNGKERKRARYYPFPSIPLLLFLSKRGECRWSKSTCLLRMYDRSRSHLVIAYFMPVALGAIYIRCSLPCAQQHVGCA